MTISTTYLTLALVATAIVITRCELLLLLPSLLIPVVVRTIGAVIVVAVGAMVVVVITVVVRGPAVVRNIGCYGKERLRRWSSLQLDLEIEKFLMNFCNRWCGVSAFNLIDKLFVLLWQSFKEILNLVFKFVWLTQDSQLIKPSSVALDVGFNRHRAFGPVLDLVTQLLNVGT